MGLILRICWSSYLNRAREGERRKTVFATSSELQTIPRPSLTCMRSYFPFSTLSLTTLLLHKSFLGFALKGQRDQKGGATELEKIPLQTTQVHMSQGLVLVPVREERVSLPQGHSCGFLIHSHGNQKAKVALEIVVLNIMFSWSESTGNCSEGKIIAIKGEELMWYTCLCSKHYI